MKAAVIRALTVQRLTDAEQLRRTRLIMSAAAAMVVYLIGVVTAGIVGRCLPLTLVALAMALLAAATYAVARSGRLPAAEWSTAGLVATSSVALVAMHGTASTRLSVLHIGVVLLGLAARPWMAPVQAVLAVGVVLGAVATDLPLPLSPSPMPAWLGIVQQILFATALMMTFTYGYRHLHAALVYRTATLEAAHADLLAARERLERLVGERTAELETAAADLEAFASAVAHDLRAPLRHIHSFLEVFVDEAASLGEARLAPIIAVQRSAAELAAAVETMLGASRPSPEARRARILGS